MSMHIDRSVIDSYRVLKMLLKADSSRSRDIIDMECNLTLF